MTIKIQANISGEIINTTLNKIEGVLKSSLLNNKVYMMTSGTPAVQMLERQNLVKKKKKLQNKIKLQK